MKSSSLKLSLIISCLLVGSLHAADWTTSNSLNISTNYSDNTQLSEDSDNNSDTTIQVRPGIGIQGKGARLQLDFNYSLDLVFRDAFSNLDNPDESHFLNATANIEAIEDNLFINVAANAGITSVTRSEVTATDTVTDSDNTAQTYSLSISPNYRYRFGSYADLSAQYDTDAFATDSSGSNDSDSQSLSVSLNSGSRFTILNWGVSVSHSQLEYDDDREDETTTLNTNLSYRINRKFTADLSVGYEDNDVGTTQEDDDDGITWDVGTTWTPNPRTTMKLSYGSRFFGEDWAFDLDYRHRKSSLTASYQQSLTNSRTLRQESLQQTDFDDNPVFDQDRFDPTLPDLNDTQNIVEDRFQLAYQYSSRRTTLGMDVSYSEREFQESNESTEDLSAGLSLSRKLTPLTSLTSGMSWVTTKSNDETASEDEILTVRLGLNTSIGPNSSLSVDVQRSENDATEDSDSYEENRVSASLAMSF